MAEPSGGITARRASLSPRRLLEVSEHFTRSEIADLLDPCRHLGETANIARAMAEHARRVADTIQIPAV